jgi:hypothetical protein
MSAGDAEHKIVQPEPAVSIEVMGGTQDSMAG